MSRFVVLAVEREPTARSLGRVRWRSCPTWADVAALGLGQNVKLAYEVREPGVAVVLHCRWLVYGRTAPLDALHAAYTQEAEDREYDVANDPPEPCCTEPS